MVKITKRSVEAAAKTGKEYFLWDDELRGFGLRFIPRAEKSTSPSSARAGASGGSTSARMARSLRIRPAPRP